MTKPLSPDELQEGRRLEAAQFEATLTDTAANLPFGIGSERSQYNEALCKLIHGCLLSELNQPLEWHALITATALQRCLAFVAVRARKET